MSERLQDAFEVCIGALDTGVDLEQCLSLYPEFGQELREGLESYLLLKPLRKQTVPDEAQQRSRTRMLERAAELRKQGKLRAVWWAPRFAIASLAVLLAFLVGSTGLFAASAQALPGDSLYTVKRTAENMSLSLAPNLEVKQSLQTAYGKRRLDETQSLLKQGREEDVEFSGVVSIVSDEIWKIDGLEVFVGPDTEVRGFIEPGMEIEVKGVVRPQGWIEADSIIIRTFRMQGEVQSMGQNVWIVGGLELELNPITIVDRSLHTGDRALTLVRVEEDGRLTPMVILRSADPNGNFPVIPIEGLDQSEGASTELHTVEFSGSLESISGNIWFIAGRRVIVPPSALINGLFRLGGQVRVLAVMNADGELVALEIERVFEDMIEGDDQADDEPSNLDEEHDDGGEESEDESEKEEEKSDDTEDEPVEEEADEKEEQEEEEEQEH